MFTKHRSYISALIALFFILHPVITRTNHYSEQEVVDLEGFFIPHEWSEEDEATYEEMLSRSSIDPETIIETIIDLGLQNIIEKQNLYKRTNPLNVRPVQDLPSLHFVALNHCYGNNEFGLTFFFNQMRKAFLTKCSPYIESYLAIGSSDLIEELDKIDEMIPEIPVKFDVPEILSLFTQIKLEERRIGGLFEYQRKWNCIEWRFQLPLYYIEHNFYLTQKEREAIANEPLFQSGSTASSDCTDDDDTVEQFIKHHIVNDLLGIGDLRFQARWNVKQTGSALLALSAEFTFPTDIIFKNGLVGEKFKKKPCQPKFEIFDFVCTAAENATEAKNELIDLGTEALDRLARIAGATDLGGQHFGIGPVIETRFWANHSLNWYNKFRFHYLIPNTIVRFFKPTKNPSEFDRNYADPDLALANLQFLSTELVNTLFPPAVCTKVYPGLIMEFTTAAHFDCDHVHGEVGYDFWYQGSESLTPKDSCYPASTLEVGLGKLFSAYQHKVFAKVFWDKVWCCKDWRVGLVGDFTFSSQGIGKDWTLGGEAALRF